MKQETYDAFIELQSDSSKNGKSSIIKKHLNNEEFVFIMKFLLNPYVLTGISTKKINKQIKTGMLRDKAESIKGIIGYLTSNNTGKDYDIAVCQEYLNTIQDEKIKSTCKEIITKSLKLGVDSNWNKSVPKEHQVPEFDVMLAKKASEHMDKIKGKFCLTKKLDGTRIIIIKENGKVKSFTRTGQEYIGLEQIENEFRICHVDNTVWDGELLSDSEGTTSEIFTDTLKKSRSKDTGKTGLKFYAFDMLPLDEFQNGKSKKNAIQRKVGLHCFFDACPMTYSVEVKPLYTGDDVEQITVWSNYAKEQGWEGIMINLDLPYECKRTSNLLKVKEMQSCDLRVIRIEEGEGKYTGQMGKCVVEYKGGEVGVGSGWNDEERKQYYNNPEELIGAIIEVQYFEESVDSKTKQVSLRFPIFKCIRTDKTESSYN